MEDVLDVYKRIKDTSHPLVCMNECPKQLIGETRPPIAPEPGKAERFDTEYIRNGTCNLFMFVAPLLGERSYIDVHTSFSSFLPNGLPDTVAERLVNVRLDRLDAKPELHDKIEFSVVYTMAEFGLRKSVEELKGTVVCIDSADPGYDWVFTHSSADLVTCYGGVNSYMAIRCAEHDLPAAIGCGELEFGRIRSAASCLLDCGTKEITSLAVRQAMWKW